MEELFREYGLPGGFGPALRAEARRLARIDPLAQRSRVDLRGHTILVIDPADARDHDDAVSLERLPGGGRRLGVHIADVAEYVHEGSPIDREAFRRGNSTYFQLDTVPMLPPLLSGQLCSLGEEDQRPAISVFMDLDAEGAVREASFAESRVLVTHSLSYEEAERRIEGGDEDELDRTLRDMLALAELLRARRRAEGAMQFELPEIRAVDEGEGVETFRPAPLLRSHGIVEEFMLAANHEVGYLLRERGLPHVRRVHEGPDPEKVGELVQMLRRAGVAWKPSPDPRSREFQALAGRISSRPDRDRLLVRMLRAMKKAVYSDRDLGHFGLAWHDYVHFTSPIRRYADLLVHRQLKELLLADGGQERCVRRQGGPPRGAPAWTKSRQDFSYLFATESRRRRRVLGEVARAISEREVNSMQAEREGLRLEMTLWARRHLGDSFPAEVLEVFPTGLLLRLHPSGAEGFLPAQFLGREYYRYDEERIELRGERSGFVFLAGQELRVQLVGANLFSRRLQFSLEEASPAYETRGKSQAEES